MKQFTQVLAMLFILLGASDLVNAIEEHQSQGNGTYQASEANAVIGNFNRLIEPQKQDLLNFLRSL